MKTILSKCLFLSIACLFCFSISIFSQYSSRHFTRGADTAEIYLSCQWFTDANNLVWNGIFHSADNGQTWSVRRKTEWMVESGPLYGDSASGAVYQIPMVGSDTFGVSFDYGKTFVKKYFNGIYKSAAGCMAGELYMSGLGNYRGTGYGDTFAWQSGQNSFLLQDVGAVPGEVFWRKMPNGNNPLKLAYSNDYGISYSVTDVLPPGMPQNFDECDIHRGTLPGELYFVYWKNRDTVALYHSFDYGNTLTFQSYMLETTNEELFYTAGRTPGTFYYARRQYCETTSPFHSCVWIYFSRDYGVTFNTYFTDFDSTFTGIALKDAFAEFEVFPNPASDHLTFRFSKSFPTDQPIVVLYNSHGNAILEKQLNAGQTILTIDARAFKPGLYIYELVQGTMRKTGKVVFE